MVAKLDRPKNAMALLIVVFITALSAGVLAETYATPNAIPLTSGSDGRALRWGRCTKRAFIPEIRIEACKHLTEDGHEDGQLAWSFLGDAYADEGDNVDALNAYNRAIEVDSGRGPLERRAILYVAAGYYYSALADAEKVMTIRGSEAEARRFRCWIRGLANKELDAGLADCDRSLQLESGQAGVLDIRGFVLFRLGRTQDAIAAFTDALRIAPNRASALYMRGIVEREVGQENASGTDIAHALEIDKNIATTYARFGVKP